MIEINIIALSWVLFLYNHFSVLQTWMRRVLMIVVFFRYYIFVPFNNSSSKIWLEQSQSGEPRDHVQGFDTHMSLLFLWGPWRKPLDDSKVRNDILKHMGITAVTPDLAVGCKFNKSRGRLLLFVRSPLEGLSGSGTYRLHDPAIGRG